MANTVWTDPSLTPLVSVVDVVHVTQLRTAVNSLETTRDSNATAVSTLQGQMTTANTNIGTLQTNVTNLQNLTPTATAITPGTAAWYRVASSAIGIGTNFGNLIIQWFGTGAAGVVDCVVACANGVTTGTVIKVISFNSISTTAGITQLRIVYHTTPSGNYAYVEFYNNTNVALTVTTYLTDALGWSLITPSTAGSIPGGYSTVTLACMKDDYFYTGSARPADAVADSVWLNNSTNLMYRYSGSADIPITVNPADYSRMPTTITTTGTGSAYVLTPAIPATAYAPGQVFFITPNTVSLAAPTINVSALGTKNIVDEYGTGLIAGALVAGRTYAIVYDGTSFRMLAHYEGVNGVFLRNNAGNMEWSADRTTWSAAGGGAGIELFANNALFSGNKKVDTQTWDGMCVYASTNGSTITTLTEVITDKIKLGLQTVIVRLKSANNGVTADVVKVEIFRNVAGSYTSVTSKTFKPTAFNSTADYETFYVPFEYKGGKATNNQVKIAVTLLVNSTVFEVDLDSVTIIPSTIGIVG